MEENGDGGWRSGLSRRHRRFLKPAEMNRSLQFFKIILASSIREEKLKMPKKFVGMCGQELSSNALLTVPNGGVWQVGLEKADGQIWFCDGWNKFIDYYSIDYGFLLLFKYEGNSSFQVLIFDTTTFEIQYPRHDGMQLPDGVKKSDSIISIPSSCGYSDQYIDDERLYRPHASKLTCTSLRFNLIESGGVETRNKSKRKSEIYGCEIESKRCKVEDCMKIEDFDVKNDPRRKLPSETRTATSCGREMPIRAAMHREAWDRNPSFVVIIHQRNIEKNYMYIPSSFATEYMSSEEEIIEIQGGSEGRKWKVCCNSSGRTSKRMGIGWKVFCRESNLRAGDVVVFELVKWSKNRVMKFTVFSSAAI